MRLKNVALTSIIAMALIIMGAEFIVSIVIVKNGFNELEQQQVATDVRRVKNELHKEIESLDIFLWDWSTWDDTYDFAQNQSPAYIKSNLVDSTFLEQNLNIVIVLDPENQTIFARAMNEEGKADESLAHEFLAMIRGSDLPKITQEGGEGGLILLSKGPMFFAKRPILYSSGEGPAAGFIIMARFLAEDTIESLSKRLEIPFSVSLVERNPQQNTVAAPLKQLLADGNDIIAVKDQNTIEGVTLLRDIYDHPALILTISEPRTISKHGLAVAYYNTFLAGVILVFFSLLIYILLQKRVISRVVNLSEQVKKIDISKKAAVRVSTTGNDEISELAESVNAMLVKIAEDQKKLSLAHDFLEDKVAERTSELEKANQELLCLDKAKSHFLASTSHELRTPLTAILGFLKLMERSFRKHFQPHLKGADEATRHMGTFLENFRIVRHETNRLGRLINDLLDLNKIEANRMDWRDKDLDVKEIVHSAANAIYGQLNDNPDVELTMNIPSSLPPLHADADRIHQVLINLLNNAAKFTEHGTVTISVRDTGEHALEFSVMDTGKGIPEKDLDQVFDIFHQSQDEEYSGPPLGTGLGLAICKEIVEHYGGRIWVESTIGKGSAFKFLLPL